MLSMMMGIVLFAAVPQDEPAQVDYTQEFNDLCKSLVSAQSYAFEMVTKSEGGGFGRRRPGGEEAREPTKISGKFQKGQPFHVKSGTVEAYRLEEDTVYRQGEEGWQFFDPEAMRSAFRRGGERSGEREAPRPQSEEEILKNYDKDGDGKLNEEEQAEADKAREEERPRRTEGDRRGGFSGMREIFMLTRLDSPHSTIEKILDKVTDLKREAGEEKNVYSGTLTKEGAQALMGGMMRFGRRGGDEGPSFDYAGSIRLTTDASGKLQQIEYTTKIVSESH